LHEACPVQEPSGLWPVQLLHISSSVHQSQAHIFQNGFVISVTHQAMAQPQPQHKKLKNLKKASDQYEEAIRQTGQILDEHCIQENEIQFQLLVPITTSNAPSRVPGRPTHPPSRLKLGSRSKSLI
jgi:hypothetical protein